MWRRVLALLASMAAADPAVEQNEPPRAAAAVAVAYAAQARRLSPTPEPAPAPSDECCNQCNGTGKVRQPDGHVTDCPCPESCPCKSSGEPAEDLAAPGGDCPTGRCRVKTR